MPSRRWYTTIMPVAHINGKMAPVSVKVSATSDPEDLTAEGFFYGYKHKSTPNISRFGLRVHRRNLITNPVTNDEQQNRDDFKEAIQTTNTELSGGGVFVANARKAWLRNGTYATLRGFCIATYLANGLEFPTDWYGIS